MDAHAIPRRNRLVAFVLDDHRYVLLGTSVVACLGMLLSSSPRPWFSFMYYAYPVEVVMYYLLFAWVCVSVAALISKAMLRERYAQASPFTRPPVKSALRCTSYLMWAITAVLIVDRVVMGLASAWAVATSVQSRPEDALQSILYMLWHGRDMFITGIMTTIELAVLGTVIAFFLALLLVFCRIQTIDRPDNDLVRFLKVVGAWFAKVYSTVIRGTPMMVQAGIIYYGVIGILRGSGMGTTEINALWSAFTAGLVTISINSTAYMMEVLRGGIESVDIGQTEAARSLGLSQWQAMRKVVFPQGIKFAIPGLSNELVINIKDSSVLSVIGTFDLMFATNTVAGIYWQQLQANMIAAVAYLILTMVATWLLNKLSRRLGGRGAGVTGMSDSTVNAEAATAAADQMGA
ncbi:amino acid ABC transporter permease [Enorma phocaeensis]|uniref:amino acid ABC transporter permease n=1 Tax=Enorma phocaeensis TaxID=1871019 RepID=UPI0015E144BA|nr:amino acid ABC transporter permease [Enorma phocaeensis]